jgi:tripartite-type tricarboxylate transporter receptor subunit TctC
MVRSAGAAAFFALLGSFFAGEAQAQSPPATAWPQRTVKFIVPFGPGAGADIGARLLAERLTTRWGKPVVVENRPGADGLVAASAFVGAADDHTLLFAAAGSFTVHPYQHEKLPYDFDRDLQPIARISNTILGLGIPASLDIGALKDFVALARTKPGKLNAALVQGITEFVFDGFAKSADLSFTKVPYRDIVQAATDVGEGRVDVLMSSYAIMQPQAQAGRIKVLAVTSRERVSFIPAIPTAAEAGFPALEVDGLVGLFGPPGMPADLRERVGADVKAVAADPTIATRLASTAQAPNPGGPAELAASIKLQRDKIAAVAKSLGIKPKLQ